MNVLRRNNVKSSGFGSRTIVLAHGFGCDQTLWRYVIPLLSPSFRTIVFDYVGSGASDTSAYDKSRYSTLHGYAQDLCEVVEATAAAPAIIVGHSVSSMIGALAAIARPDLVAALVMLAPTPASLMTSTIMVASHAVISKIFFASSRTTTSAGPRQWPA